MNINERITGMTRKRDEAGFTLVEILVVLSIIGILSAVLISRVFSGGRSDAEKLSAKAFIQTIATSLTTYENDVRIGILPPTSAEDFRGMGRMVNRTNLGNEALVLCLNSPGFRGTRVLEDFEGELGNTDGDSSQKPLSIYDATDLFEILDPWGNPYAYFNAQDYGRSDVRQYKAMSADGGDHEIVTVTPWRNPKTKSFYKKSSYQLFSAGPDGVFNTEDDIGNW